MYSVDFFPRCLRHNMDREAPHQNGIQQFPIQASSQFPVLQGREAHVPVAARLPHAVTAVSEEHGDLTRNVKDGVECTRYNRQLHADKNTTSVF